MQKPVISSEAHDLLVTIFNDAHLLLMRESSNNWVIYDSRMRSVKPLSAPGLAEELKNHNLIEKNDDLTFHPHNARKVPRSTYDYGVDTLKYLQECAPLVELLLKREEVLAQRYTSYQIALLDNLAEEIRFTTKIDLYHAVISMWEGAAEGELYQHKNGRWRIIYEDSPSVPVRASAIQKLIEYDLIVREPGLDHYRKEEGYGNAHVLSNQANALAADSSQGNFAPRNLQLTLNLYSDYLIHLYANNLADDAPLRKLLAFLFTHEESDLFWLLIHIARKPELLEFDPGLNTLIEQLRKTITEESSTDVAVQTIKQLAEEALKLIPHQTN